jgi:hypothetical protein
MTLWNKLTGSLGRGWWADSMIASRTVGISERATMSTGRRHDSREKRHLHALNRDGMLVCNPRDREAAHRATVEGIATEQRAAVTCPKCLALLEDSKEAPS